MKTLIYIYIYTNAINQNCLDGFVYEKHAAFHFKMLIDGLESSIIVMFLSTLILTAPIHCRGSSDVMLRFSKSVSIKQQTHLYLGQQIFIFGWTIPLIS